jgi:hypothetical protein
MKLLAAAAGAGALAACGLSGITSGLSGGVFGGSSSAVPEVRSVTDEQLLAAAKADGGGIVSGGEQSAACPRIVVGPRDGHVTIYEPGRVGDGLAVMHRGEITRTARECQIDGGRVTVKYGFSGRVLLGPRGQNGSVSLPVNVFVMDARRERLAADKMKVDVAVAIDKPIGYFSMVRTVSFPLAEGSRPAEYEVFVGFERSIPNAG